MTTDILKEVKEIRTETRVAGIKQVFVTIVHEGCEVVYKFIDPQQVDMKFLMIDWKVHKESSEENVSKEVRQFAPYIVFNFVSWLLKEYSTREFKTFIFNEEDKYRIRYELNNGELKLFSHGYQD